MVDAPLVEASEVDDFAYMINLGLIALFPFPFLNYKEKYKDPAGHKIHAILNALLARIISRKAQ